MQTVSKILLAGAAVALAGAGAYAASRPIVHHLSLYVPGYGTERIEYTGDVAPKVVMTRGPFAAPSFFAPFAEINRMAMQMDAMQAQMDRAMAAHLAQFRQMQHAGDRPFTVSVGALPPGTQSYSVVTTIVGNKVCTREVRVTSNGAEPQTISSVSGDCAGGPSANGAPTQVKTHPMLPDGERHTI